MTENEQHFTRMKFTQPYRLGLTIMVIKEIEGAGAGGGRLRNVSTSPLLKPAITETDIFLP
jgi:hypothetical protein